MANLKEYEVTAKGFVTVDMQPTKVGDKVLLPPRHGNTLSGLRFKQLKPTGRTSEQAAEDHLQAHVGIGHPGQPGVDGVTGEGPGDTRQMIFDSAGLTRYIKGLRNKDAIVQLGNLNGVELDDSANRDDLEAEADLALVDRATSGGLVVNLDTLPLTTK